MDIKTIFVCLIIINLFMGIFTLIFKRIQKTYSGINYWIIGNFLISTGYLLLILRGYIPNLFSIFGANLSFISAGIIRIYGLNKFYYKKNNLLLNIIFAISLVVFIASFIYLTYIIDSIYIRTIIISIYLISLSFYTSFIILSNIPKEGKIVNIFTGIIFILFSIIFLIRAVSWIFFPQSRGLFISSLFNYITFMSNMIIDILWTTMFLMMNNQRLSFELIEKNKELEDVNILKDKFFAIIAHDLRNSFIGINSFLKILLEKIEKNDVYNFKEFAQNVKISGEKTLELLENLLKWAKSQMGLNKFNPVSMNVTNLINSIMPEFSNLIKLKKIKIKYDIDPSLLIFANKDMIDTVLRNLLTNSIKYSYQNGIIKIYSFKKNNKVIISIKDFGIGINKTDMKKLFTLENKNIKMGTNNESGSGFGLILCKEFVEKNEGKIWVESEENKGSTFFISFPENNKY